VSYIGANDGPEPAYIPIIPAVHVYSTYNAFEHLRNFVNKYTLNLIENRQFYKTDLCRYPLPKKFQMLAVQLEFTAAHLADAKCDKIIPDIQRYRPANGRDQQKT
jgi:hypothetical protein